VLRRALLALAVLTCLGGAARAGDLPRIYAHRGASGEAPGNSLLAFRLAREEGADGVELDVRRTRDGHIVVFHDRDATLPSGKRARISRLTLAELQQIDLGGGQRIPTLSQVFDVIGPDLLVNIEIKAEGLRTRGLEKEVVRIVRARGASRRVVFSSFNPFSVRRLARYAPDIQRGILVVPGRRGALLRRVAGGGANAIHPDQRMVTAQDVSHWREHGYREVNTWTVNDPARIRKMAILGVNGIITDFPAVARLALRGIGRTRPPPARAARAARGARRASK
jgi:glycerophosphoryl diester phosphodiesterase